MFATAGTVEDVQEAVRSVPSGTHVLPVAGETKPALSVSSRADVQRLDLSELSGVLEYDPAELTITARAGTPVAEVQDALAEHGQHLPFDPPLVEAGATLGGVVAAGASGAGGWRNGGVRDFVLGVRFVDGTGRVITAGARVVKNAAGFDLSKLMVGSIGRLGVIVQLSFKVFPRPAATRTLEFRLESLERATACASVLARGPVELEALEFRPTGALLARIGGPESTLDSRAARLAGMVPEAQEVMRHEDATERALWHDAAEFTWVERDEFLIRVPLSIRQVAALDRALAGTGNVASRVRYGLGGTVAWIAWPATYALDALDAILHGLGLPGMVLIGPPDRPLLGPGTGGAFGARVARALDPDRRFLEL